MTIPSTHASLLLALQGQEKRQVAWAIFDARYRDVIHGWCRRRGLRADVADDLTQDVLIKVLQELPRYNHDPSRGQFRSWLKTVVSHALVDHHRRQARHPEPVAVGGGSYLDGKTGLETPRAADELCEEIERRANTMAAAVFEGVRARVQETTWQSFYQWMVLKRPAADVARELGLTTAAVYKNSDRVRKMVIKEYTSVPHTN
jgi:RNA polymerase sigma-70 factor, ECF subfamily